MTRAITSTCLALLLLVMGGSAFAGKPTIAVLGLEVVDQNGTPTQQDTDTAKQFTEGLRGRAKLGGGPYVIAGNSDKELIDEKMIEGCNNEAEKCMAQIGSDLGADWLMYGKIEKRNGAYLVTMNLLDVHNKRRVKASSDPIPMNQAGNQVELLEWTTKIYAKLTGSNTTGGVIVKVTNADRGTILVDGQEKGNIVNGVGQVNGLPEGKVKLAVESEGFHRWEDTVTVKGGDVVNRSVTLDKTTVTGVGPGAGPGLGGGVPGPGPGPGDGGGGSRGNAMWKGVFVGSVVVTLAGGGMWIYGKGQVDDATNALRDHCGYSTTCTGTPYTQAEVDAQNSKGDSGHKYTIAGGVAVGVGGALAVVAFYEGFIAKNDNASNEHAMTGRRVHRDRFVVTPIVAPNGGGATLKFDW